MAKKESYNDMLNKLQEILTNLEQKDLELEDSIKQYEAGIKLVNKLYKTLNSLEGKLIIIKDNEEVEIKNEYDN